VCCRKPKDGAAESIPTLEMVVGAAKYEVDESKREFHEITLSYIF
jgi:hypothetical protein